MTRVLCLGGYGQFGLPTARLVSADPAVDHVVIAGRDLAKAQAVAADLGPDCEARQVDADDPASLDAALDGVSVVVSTLWSAEGRAERVARAAVAAGAHYLDLNVDLQGPELDQAARARDVALLTSVGMSPGVVDLVSGHLLDALDEPSVLVGIRHWTRLLDAWTDLFDAYLELPGGGKRGPLGRQLFSALTDVPRDPDRIAAVVRDACVVPFWLALAGTPERWSTVPVPSDGRFVDVDATREGLDLASTTGGFRRERLLAVTDRGADEAGLHRVAGSATGMGPAFDEAVRDAARRIASGADADAEVRRLEGQVTANVADYLRPPTDIATLPTAQYLAYGRSDGAPVRGSLAFNEQLFEPERFLFITAAAIAVTVRYLLDGTIATRGASTMAAVIPDVDRFAADYMRLLPSLPEGEPLFDMRVDPA